MTICQSAGIPVLDLGPWSARVPGARDRLAADLRSACRESGFFFLVNHGVDESLIDRAFDQTAAFHALPEEAKAAYRINEHNIGYMASRTSMQRSSVVKRATRPNLVASYFMKRERHPDDPVVVAGLPLRGMNQWPDELPRFRETMLASMTALEALGRALLPVFARALGLSSDFFAPFFREPSITLRISRYPSQAAFDGEEFGTGPHTDAGFVTFLAQSDVRGLDILCRDGTWLPVPVIPAAFSSTSARCCHAGRTACGRRHPTGSSISAPANAMPSRSSSTPTSTRSSRAFPPARAPAIRPAFRRSAISITSSPSPTATSTTGQDRADARGHLRADCRPGCGPISSWRTAWGRRIRPAASLPVLRLLAQPGERGRHAAPTGRRRNLDDQRPSEESVKRSREPLCEGGWLDTHVGRD